jgi:hypothetical protein
MVVPSAFFLNLRPRVVTKSSKEKKKKLSFASVAHSPSINFFHGTITFVIQKVI